MATINTYAQTLKVVDYTLQGLGYIPFVSSVSGNVRSYYGLIQAVSAVAVGIMLAVGAITPGAVVSALVTQLFISGVLHVLRGTVEQVPFFGNGACIAYDIARFILK